MPAKGEPPQEPLQISQIRTIHTIARIVQRTPHQPSNNRATVVPPLAVAQDVARPKLDEIHQLEEQLLPLPGYY